MLRDRSRGWHHLGVLLSLLYLSVPKISSAQVGGATQFRRPYEVIALPWSHSLRHDDRLCCSSDWDKDFEILALRHPIMVLERQLGKSRPHLLAQRPCGVPEVRTACEL